MSCCAFPIPAAQVDFFRGLRHGGEGGFLCSGTSRCVSSQTLSISSAGKKKIYVLGLPVGNNNRKILSISFSMPGAVISESLDFCGKED